MKQTFLVSSAFALAACVAVLMPVAAGGVDDDGSPIFGVKLPAGYRDWQLIGLAHEAGSLNDLRAVLGNRIAVKAYREGTRPFPDGAIIGRLAWRYVPSDENNAIFGQVQSFVPGHATNIQFSVKDIEKYANTGGWGYGQFEDGKPNRSEALMNTCFPCHARANKADDFVFTRYTP
ncbi:cytochrome P460 family protein [Methylobacterium sp. NEAU K]|uniref:cytochrome P460 family protein n=1 Tax=Methylobacterium sp. NEAU K TaxID=3064946 RepID=UPI0027336522|nr:cytochrome P460 family protein [Methylobacterium sp. NEAU K]MDP4004778.1 cytochrome P460 family protein [Methylobacterium sp. NEAU K]